MGRLDELDLSHATGLASAKWPDGEGPKSLRLRWCRLGDRGIAALARWPGLRRVRYLHLCSSGIGEAGLKALRESPHTASLEALGIDPIGEAPLAAFLASPLGARLKWLCLDDGLQVDPDGRDLRAR